jgi:hypothetical protein
LRATARYLARRGACQRGGAMPQLVNVGMNGNRRSSERRRLFANIVASDFWSFSVAEICDGSVRC